MTGDADRGGRDAPGVFPEDYHDYVFKDGRLVGDFDNMYRHAKGVPWDQDTRCDRWYAQVAMAMLAEEAPYDSILEIGCGLGYITAKLKVFTRGEDSPVHAFDLSTEAVRKASSLHPGISFYVDDIAAPSFRPRQQYHLVVVRDVFWYLVPKLQTVAANIRACIRPEGRLYIGQSFPRLDGPFVGKETIPTPEALLALFPDFDPIYSAQLRNHRLVADGPILHFLGSRAR